ncbi:Six-hairpin glycosidase [Penicillium alfredii]|uniref:alpha,alpha-trehalase n=1 Tax=Penicillium alfredii TaxID=1506179 RepID=A0A9W9KCM2_9EURO|nr:Six-hairpin glycosidase [Penicillium alfredii]KAJ5101414.1 Six-hairpin glycosidase [Penicillium alfredii]
MRCRTFASAFVPLLLHLGALADASSPTDRIAKCMKRYTGAGTSANFSSNVYRTDFPGVTWDEDNWLLSTTTLEQGRYESRGSVANGYIGINVASVGPFFELDTPEDGDVINGWPLFSRRQSFATVSGFFDSQPSTNGTNFPWLSQYGGDSVISGVPHWSGLILDLGDDDYLDATVDNKTLSNFRSTYDFKAGVLVWSYQWTPKGNKGSYKIIYRLFANKLHINQAVVDMEIVSSKESQGSIVNVIDGFSAVRTDFVESDGDDGAIFSAVRPNGISNVTAYVYANISGSPGVDLSSRQIVSDKRYVHDNESSIAQALPVKFAAGKTVHLTKYVGLASSDAFKDPKQTAKKAASMALARGYSASLRSHIAEWANVMPDDSVDHYTLPENKTLPADNYIIESAIIAVTNTYYLLQNTVGKNAAKAVSRAPVNVDSISVGGLTSDSYGGQVFWDADVWMQPGLAASHPEAAQRFTNYRLAKYGQAQENIKTAFTGSRNKTYFSPSAAAYPWTSGRFGNCTATGPCWDYEYHLNGDIGLSMINQWVASGDTQFFKEHLFPVYDSMATLYANLLVQNGSSWTLTNMTDPDEYANHVDAGGFTMPLIAETLVNANAFRQQFGLEENKTWNQMASEVLFLRENGITLEFTTMNGSTVVKQADVVLATYPLDYTSNYSTQDSLNDLDFYANKQSADGPAMTWAIFSIVANEVSPSGCSAYTYAQYSYKPYARAPFFQLSEQMVDDPNTNGGTHPAYPFLTGHGGADQVVLFGYLGLRLLADDFLHVDPNLPPQIPYLKYRTFYWRGWPISAWANYTHTTISHDANTPPLDTADKRFANKTITIKSGPDNNTTTYRLSLSGSVVVPNRQIGSQNTVAGNLVQCQPIKSSNNYEPGQFPISAIDGATSTKWQPSAAANMSSITVSFAEEEAGALVSGFHFDWAQAPPVNATVIFHNKTLSNPATAYSASKSSSDYTVVTSLTNIKQSQPYHADSTNLDAIAIPVGNTTNVTLPHPVIAARFASLLIVGNQALGPVDVQAKNGTGATVAEWAVIGHDKKTKRSPSGSASAKRKMNVRAAAAVSGKDFVKQRRRFLPN